MKMKIFWFCVVFVHMCCFSVHCGSDVWTPKHYVDFLSNKSKTISDNIVNEANNFTKIMKNYADVAKHNGENLVNDFTDLFKKTKQQINETFVNYLTSVNNVENMYLNKKMDSADLKNSKDTTVPDKNGVKVFLDAPQLIAMYGYNVETHTVVTEDGYILKLHRIPHGKNIKVGNTAPQAVLIQHGLFSSSVDFVTSGPQNGLPFLLADAGYDVWLGNFRGNSYSQGHIKYSTDEASFWNFSWHDIGLNDLPAMIDYINAMKKSTGKTLYIGHSMGNTALYVLLSMKPEYNNKLKAAFCLAPVAYMKSLKSPLRHLAPFVNGLEWVREYIGLNEFKPQHSITKTLGSSCANSDYEELVCKNVMFLLVGFDDAQFNKKYYSTILSHSPSDTSTKAVIHYAQLIRDEGKFKLYDYGTRNNLKKYGQRTPPEYPLHKITLPISLIVSENDWLVSLQDSKKLYEDLPNAIELHNIPLKDFNHVDFLWAKDAKHLLYNHLLTKMEDYKSRETFLWSLDNLNFKLNWESSN